MEDAELETAASDLHDLQHELGCFLFTQLLLLGDVVEEVLFDHTRRVIKDMKKAQVLMPY